MLREQLLNLCVSKLNRLSADDLRRVDTMLNAYLVLAGANVLDTAVRCCNDPACSGSLSSYSYRE